MSLERLFKPRSVAVIGASRAPGKVGHEVLRNIIESGFEGRVYPVNPNANSILGLKAYPSIMDVPDEIDVAVIAVPAQMAVKIAEECGRKGVKFLVVISAGFREVGVEGLERERALIEIARRYGMRVLGPNCLGFIDLHTPINATFTKVPSRKGGVAFVSQSGALLSAILDWAEELGIGFSKIIALGNKADLDEADFLEYLAKDDETNVVLLYLESINGPRFIEAARKAVREKPVLLLKGGVTEAGVKAALSHTGSLTSFSKALDAACRKAGVVKIDALGELFDTARLLASGRRVKGRKAAIVTNAGGVGVLLSDELARRGFELARLGKETIDVLRSRLPKEASVMNPIDVLGDARADRYKAALDAVLQDPNVDVVIAALTPQAMTEPEETAKAIIEFFRRYEKPIIAVFIGGEKVEKARRMLANAGVPIYEVPEKAVIALSKAIKYEELKERIVRSVEHVEIQVNIEGTKRVIERLRKGGAKAIIDVDAFELLSAYGIKTPRTVLVKDEEDAVRAAREMGFPVVLKVSSPDILHKTDIGGVRLGLKDEEEVRRAFREIIENVRKNAPYASVRGVIVQEHVERGFELLIGVVRDPTFGHVLAFGTGGVYANIFEDVSHRLVPVSYEEAYEMIDEVKISKILRGFRGEPGYDVDCIVDVIVRVSKLVTDFPEIAELDVNPLFAYRKGRGCIAVDVKGTLE